MKMDLIFFIWLLHLKSSPKKHEKWLVCILSHLSDTFTCLHTPLRWMCVFSVHTHTHTHTHPLHTHTYISVRLMANVQQMPRLWESVEPVRECRGRKSSVFYSPAMPLFFIFFSSLASPVVARDAGSQGPGGEIVIWTIWHLSKQPC